VGCPQPGRHGEGRRRIDHHPLHLRRPREPRPRKNKEEEHDSTGTWKTSKSYSYGAHGENLSLVDSSSTAPRSKKSFYGTNPHGEVETLPDSTTGSTTSTYRYTAYGQPDKKGTTGDDAITATDPNADIVHPCRLDSALYLALILRRSLGEQPAWRRPLRPVASPGHRWRHRLVGARPHSPRGRRRIWVP
jgi:hypothetical protein